jgi:hypothetical protein
MRCCGWCRVLGTITAATQWVEVPRHLGRDTAEAGALALAHTSARQDVDPLRCWHSSTPCRGCATAVVGLRWARRHRATATAAHGAVALEVHRDRATRLFARAASRAAASRGIVDRTRGDVGAPARSRGRQMFLCGGGLLPAAATTANWVISPRDRSRCRAQGGARATPHTAARQHIDSRRHGDAPAPRWRDAVDLSGIAETASRARGHCAALRRWDVFAPAWPRRRIATLSSCQPRSLAAAALRVPLPSSRNGLRAEGLARAAPAAAAAGQVLEGIGNEVAPSWQLRVRRLPRLTHGAP